MYTLTRIHSGKKKKIKKVNFLYHCSIDGSEIILPADFDPTAALDHLEALQSFTHRTAGCLPPTSLTHMVGFFFTVLLEIEVHLQQRL